MYAIVRKLKSRNPNELVNKMREPMTQLVKQGSGFVTFCAVKNPDGTFSSITICQEKKQCEELARKGQDLFKQHAPNLIEGQPEYTIGEVVIYIPSEVEEPVT